MLIFQLFILWEVFILETYFNSPEKQLNKYQRGGPGPELSKRQ